MSDIYIFKCTARVVVQNAKSNIIKIYTILNLRSSAKKKNVSIIIEMKKKATTHRKEKV